MSASAHYPRLPGTAYDARSGLRARGTLWQASQASSTAAKSLRTPSGVGVAWRVLSWRRFIASMKTWVAALNSCWRCQTSSWRGCPRPPRRPWDWGSTARAGRPVGATSPIRHGTSPRRRAGVRGASRPCPRWSVAFLEDRLALGLGRIGIHTVTAAQGDAGQQHDEQGLQLHGKALFQGRSRKPRIIRRHRRLIQSRAPALRP